MPLNFFLLRRINICHKDRVIFSYVPVYIPMCPWQAGQVPLITADELLLNIVGMCGWGFGGVYDFFFFFFVEGIFSFYFILFVLDFYIWRGLKNSSSQILRDDWKKPSPHNKATCWLWVVTRNAWGRDPGGWAVCYLETELFTLLATLYYNSY